MFQKVICWGSLVLKICDVNYMCRISSGVWVWDWVGCKSPTSD